MKQIIIISILILSFSTLYAEEFEDLIANDNAIIFAHQQPIIGNNLTFEQKGCLYDRYYSDPDTGWTWRSSPHWKIYNTDGYIKIGFTGQQSFVFTGLGSESGGQSKCNIQIKVNDKVLQEKFFVSCSWHKYIIPKEYFANGENDVEIIQLAGTSLWITEAHTSPYDPNDGIEIIKSTQDNRNHSTVDTLDYGRYIHVNSTNDIDIKGGEVSVNNDTISLYKANFVVNELQSAEEFEIQFRLLCNGPDDFKIGLGNAILFRFLKNHTYLTKWMGSNFSAPLMDLDADNSDATYRILYKDGRLKLYYNNTEYCNIAMDIHPGDIRFTTGGGMKAELQDLRLRVN